MRLLGVLCLVASAIGQNFDSTTCGVQKGCLFFPTGCSPTRNDCTNMFSYVLDNSTQRLEMQLSGSLPANAQYIALGFSDDAQMGDDMVVACANVNNQATASLSHNVGRSNQVIATNGILQTTGSSINGNTVSCSFSLPLVSPSGVTGAKNLNTIYYPLMAVGPIGSNGQLQYHSARGALPRTDFTVYQREPTGTVRITGGTNMEVGTAQTQTDKLLIAHGILMTCAWTVFLSTGILAARYFKDHMPNTVFLGVKMWFNLHRAANLLGIASTICGFVIIFVANDWNWRGPKATQTEAQNRSWGSIHSILGLLACVIAWAQPLNAVFRCDHSSKLRIIFNSIHRFLGSGAFVLALSAIMIACVHFTPMFLNRDAALGLFIGYVAVLGICIILMEIVKILKWWKNRSQVHSSEMEMSRMGVNSSSRSRTYDDEDANRPYNNAISFIFLFHTVVAVGVAVAISTLIALKK